MRKKEKHNHIKQKIDGGLNLKFKRKGSPKEALGWGMGILKRFSYLSVLKTEYLRSLLKAARPLPKRRLLGKAGSDQSLPGGSLSPAVPSTVLGHLMCPEGQQRPLQMQNDSHGKLTRLLMRRQSHHLRM